MTTFAEENTKLLRQAPNIGIRVIVGTTTIMEFNNENLISVKVSLRGPETKAQDPDFPASDIEIEAYYPGDTSDFLQYMGRETAIQYKCSYQSNIWTNDVSQRVGVRAFYTSFNEDTLQISEHRVKIKATDAIGAFQDTGSDWVRKLDVDWEGTQHSIGGETYMWIKLADMIAAYVGSWGIGNVYSVGTVPQAWLKAWFRNYGILRYPELRRKKLATLANIFRGTSPSCPSVNVPLYKRFVFRDAGAPMRIWFDKLIDTSDTNYTQFKMWRQYNIANKLYNDAWTSPIWDISYSEVSNLKYDYGMPIKTISLNNPLVYRGIVKSKTGTQLQSKAAMYIDLDGPADVLTATANMTSGSAPIMKLYEVSPTRCLLKTTSFNGEGTVRIDYHEVLTFYDNDSSDTQQVDIEYDTGLSAGDTVYIGPIYGLRVLGDAYSNDWSTHYTSNLRYIASCIGTSYGYNPGLKRPTWINFTWRGHPGMQPRDIIRFTEKDGTQNYYEVDNLTLDHENGGLTSTVKAMLIRSA